MLGFNANDPRPENADGAGGRATTTEERSDAKSTANGSDLGFGSLEDLTGRGSNTPEENPFAASIAVTTNGPSPTASPPVPVLMAADLLGIDLLKPPSDIYLESDRKFTEPDHGLVKNESAVKYLGRPITWAEVDKWYLDRGLPNAAREMLASRQRAAAAQAQQEAQRKVDEHRRRQQTAKPIGPDGIRALFGGDPVPLGVRTGVLPQFPVDALPGAYREMVSASAVAWQVDTAMSGPVALAALAAACGGCVEAAPRPGWDEVTALHILVASNPSERKSSLINALGKPLVDAERTLVELAAPRHTEALTRRAIAEQAAKDAEKAAAKYAAGQSATNRTDDSKNASADPLDLDPIAQAVALANRAAAISIPGLPRLLADDVTPEALSSLLAENNGRIAIMSAEGGIFQTLAGRYSNNVPSLDVWLKGYSGDPIRVDRKGRAPELIDRPALTACLMLQPSVLASIGSNPDFRGRGLLARALFSLPVPMLGRRETDPPPVPETVLMAYSAALSGLAVELRAARGDDDDDGPIGIKFDAGAGRAVSALLADTEPRLIDPNDLGAAMESWGGKYVGNVVRIATLLHMAEHGPGGVGKAVTAETFDAARTIGEFFAAHSASALGGGSAAGDVTAAETVLMKLRELHAATPFRPINRRDLGRKMPRGLRRVKDLDDALDVLADHNLVVCVSSKVGGATTTAIYLHPDSAA